MTSAIMDVPTAVPNSSPVAMMNLLRLTAQTKWGILALGEKGTNKWYRNKRKDSINIIGILSLGKSHNRQIRQSQTESLEGRPQPKGQP